jgi:hypothetical protein
LWDNLPSLRYLTPNDERLTILDAGRPPAFATDETAAVFLWPYEDPRPVLNHIPPGTLIEASEGPLARGDLEPQPYSLYSLYQLAPAGPIGMAPAARFEGGIVLAEVEVERLGEPATVELHLLWRAAQAPVRDVQVFVHAMVAGQIVAQADSSLGTRLYPSSWWRSGEIVRERRQLRLPPSVAPDQVTIRLGLYRPDTGSRLRRADAAGDALDIAP